MFLLIRKQLHRRATMASASRRLFSSASVNVQTTSHRQIPTSSPALNIPLTVVDLHLRNEQLPFAYFFDEKLDAEKLETSLGKVLATFPQMGGRIQQHLAIQCTPSDTVSLSFGDIDMTLAEWQSERRGHLHQAGNGHPILSPLFDTLFQDDDNNKQDGALTTIRVTYFSCGATGIGVNLNHALGDTASCIQFVESWGKEMRNKSFENKTCNNIRANASVSGMMNPNFVDLMGLEEESQATNEPFIFSRWSRRLLSAFSKNSPSDKISSTTTPASSAAPVDHEYVRLAFSPQLLQAMKAHGMAECTTNNNSNETTNDSFVSTNDVVTAFGWLMKRELSDKPHYNISVVVNLRGRFGIHKGLFGNGITHVVAKLPATVARQQIQMADISQAAMSIRKAITKGMLKVPECLARSKLGKTIVSAPDNSTSTFSSTSWGQFPLYKISFGSRSLTSFSGQPAHPLPIGQTFASVITPTANGGYCYAMLLPSDKAEEARLLHQQLSTCFLNWSSTAVA